MLTPHTQWLLPKIIAHRGAPQCAPENTLASLRQAKILGAQWVEFDVRLTSDCQAVIFHDDELNRTTNGGACLLADTPYSVIAQLDAGSWFNAQFQNERVPTLGQYLQAAATLKLGINIELKGTDFLSTALVKQVAAGLQQYWKTSLPTPLISSFSVIHLQAMRAESSDYLLGYIVDEWIEHWPIILQELACISLHVNYEQLTPERIQAVKNKNYRLLAYTVNDKQLAERLFSWGVDAVFSDNPQLWR